MYSKSATTILLACFFLAAPTLGCDGCKEHKPKKIPEKVEKPVDAGKPDTGDPLKMARMEAEQTAELAAVRRSDRAAAVVAEVEAAAKDKKRPHVRHHSAPTGKIDKHVVAKVFHRHDAMMRKCYERSLKKNPQLEGKVKLDVLIRRDGSVGRAHARGISLKEDTVHDCMEREARSMKFPKPKGGSVRVAKAYSFFPKI